MGASPFVAYLLVRLAVALPLLLPLAAIVVVLTDAAASLLPQQMPASLRAAAQGSAAMAVASAAVAGPAGVAAGAVLHERASSSRGFAWVAAGLGPALGGPSVLTGLLAVALLTRGLGLQRSFGVAAVTLGLWLLPRVAVASLEVLATLPQGLREAGLALGASRSAVFWAVVMPACAPRLALATLRTVALGVGQAAPLLVVLGDGLAQGADEAAPAALSLPTLAFAAATEGGEAARPLAAASLSLLLALQAGVASLGGVFARRVGRKGNA